MTNRIINRLKNSMLAILLIMVSFVFACEKNTENINTDIDANNQITMGTVEVEFKIPDGSLKEGCIKRAELVLAVEADSLYQGKYLVSFNVSDEQTVYTVRLKPGSYHYMAGIICLCETNACSGSGFAGGQYGLKYTADKFYITADEVTHVAPIFY